MSPREKYMKRTLIVTGASSGMGREFALTLAKKLSPEEVWLVARSEEKLKEVADNIAAPCLIIPADLSTLDGLEKLFIELEKRMPDCICLVNGAGFGKFGGFEDIELKSQQEMIFLNCTALMSICHRVGEYMKKGGVIYNIGSLSSFQPVPYINTYGATKAFVLSFSRALNREWKKRGIKVMAVSPGWVKTDFFQRAVKDDTIKYYNKFFTAEQVVKRALSDMERSKDVSVCGFSIRCQVLACKLLPHKLVMAIWCKQQKK
ncbi:MAG: SDR family NAD(P)-dependent oxidoreductase [Ruminococcaceae bacterium]|nr:SDR family NAD(P)-dependent oxidoreductase [Oscillospiraceae bacterium]